MTSHTSLPIEKNSEPKLTGVAASGIGAAPASLADDDDEEIIDVGRHATFRAVTARANYLALDRPDIQHAVK